MPPPDSSYPLTYYSSSTELPAPFSALQGSISADVCVVGGGIAGCAAALELAERGYRVVLLEAERIGWGASGRSGGQVMYGLAVEQAELERELGASDAHRIWEISLAGLSWLKNRIQRHAIDCDWVAGQMSVAIKPRQWQQLQQWHRELASRYGYASAELLERDQLRAVLESERYLGALYDRSGGHLHSLRYTLGLARAAASAGVEIHEASRVSGYAHAGSTARVQIQTRQGTVDCAYALFAGNAWLADTVPQLQRMLLPIASYIVATEPLGAERARRLIGNDAAVCDTNWILDYFRRSADHRLLFGGRVNYSGINVRAIAKVSVRRMLRVFPQLAGTRIDYAWGCLIDITRNRTPHFGRLAPNVFFLQGFSGHGLALAGIGGMLAAEAIAGTAERFDVLARLPQRAFPGGAAVRRPLLALAMLWYRLRDWL
jgi:gamma-glutamylputrescine oxidase